MDRKQITETTLTIQYLNKNMKKKQVKNGYIIMIRPKTQVTKARNKILKRRNVINWKWKIAQKIKLNVFFNLNFKFFFKFYKHKKSITKRENKTQGSFLKEVRILRSTRREVLEVLYSHLCTRTPSERVKYLSDHQF